MSTKRRWWVIPAVLVAVFMIRVAVRRGPEPAASAHEDEPDEADESDERDVELDDDEPTLAGFATFGQDKFAVGEDGVIPPIMSWFYQQSGTEADLLKVWGSGPDDVFVSGDEGLVLHSKDRGASWTRIDEDDNT